MFVSVPFRSCSDGDVTFLQTEDALELLQKYSFTILDLSRPSQEKKRGNMTSLSKSQLLLIVFCMDDFLLCDDPTTLLKVLYFAKIVEIKCFL